MDRALPPAWAFIGLTNWLALLNGLVARNIVSRFAGGLIGYFWAIIVPVSWIMAITLFFVLLGRSAPLPVPLPIFVATGMLPYLIFRQGVTAMMRAERFNRHLIVAGIARPGDVLIATAALEAITATLIVIVVLIFVGALGAAVAPQNLLRVIAGFGLAWAVGASFGCLMAVLARRHEALMRLVPIILRPFFWISGIFFLAYELPLPVADALWWNPLLHVTEFLRGGYFRGFSSDFFDLRVPLAWAGLFLLLAFVAERSGYAVKDAGSALK